MSRLSRTARPYAGPIGQTIGSLPGDLPARPPNRRHRPRPRAPDPRFQASLGVFILIAGGQLWSDSWWADSDSAHVGRAGQVPMEETRNSMFHNPKSLLIIVACICFAIAVLTVAGILSIGSKIDWTDLGLFFGFLSFIV